jgi:GST-like protein
MIDLYGMSSPNVLKIILALEECDFEYTYHFVNIITGEQFKPEFIALNPMAKVPVIIDHDGYGGLPYTVFESGAILIYIAEKAGKFIPPDPRLRMDTLQWLVLQIANVGPMFGQHTHFVRFAPPGNEYSASRYKTFAGRLYDSLEERLGTSTYLAGEDYTIADIATFPWVALYLEIHGLRWDDHPNLRRWRDLIAGRPAANRAMVLYEELFAKDPSQKPDLPKEGFERLFGWGTYARK